MVEVQRLRDDQQGVIDGLKKRQYSYDDLSIVEEVLEIDDRRKRAQHQRDELLAQVNTLSKEIGELYRNGMREKAEKLKAAVAKVKEQSSSFELEVDDLEQSLVHLLLTLPNIPHNSVPAGKGEDDNEVYQPWDQPLPEPDDGWLPHWELAEKYGLLDAEAGVKIAGSGFPLFRGKGAKYERALINFFLAEASNAGYEEISPPLLVNADTAMGTGQLPDKDAQMYYIEKDEYYLLPTAEVPLTNIYRNTIFDREELPVKMAGYTPCFRREAGSYGADVKGLNRVHQFDKVEIVQIVPPENSYDVLDEMVEHVKGLLIKLGLPYRILKLCGGDLGFTAALTYDFEVYSAAQERWLEVSSVSNFESFQSNRMQMRYRIDRGKKDLVHTLNGSALALARIFAALVENYQREDQIYIPEALQPYTGFSSIS